LPNILPFGLEDLEEDFLQYAINYKV